mmetsp:Transcript_47253/g.94144  ORF Transcript_47253/g.94144 Transcript_47253/m.94144 type:complete len:107 (-) Transcript_47253:209-529(-)
MYYVLRSAWCVQVQLELPRSRYKSSGWTAQYNSRMHLRGAVQRTAAQVKRINSSTRKRTVTMPSAARTNFGLMAPLLIDPLHRSMARCKRVSTISASFDEELRSTG